MGERRIMDRYVLIFPGASIPEKEIGRDLLSVMVRILLQDTEYKVILAGRENDRVDMPLIGLDRGRVEDWSGKTDLAVLFNLVAHAECVICNDSGPMHAAALLNKKNIVISTGAAFFPETTGYNDDVLVFVPEADCYPCPWIGYPCSKGFSCKVQFDPEWVSSWMLHYLRKGGRPLSGGKNKAYRTMIDTVKGLTFVPCGDNVLYGAEWAGLIYQSFWKERLLGLNAETVLEALLRPYQGISDKLTDQIAAFRGELEKGSRLSDHLLHAFALLEKYHNKSFVTAIQEGIEALFQWSEQDSLLAPVLQYHKMAYHSAVFGHGEALLGAYYGNTIRLKKDMDRLRELIAVFQSHYLMKQCGYKDGECLADAFSETALP
jgi:hypothetical protein